MLLFLIIEILPQENIYQKHPEHFGDDYFYHDRQWEKLARGQISPAFSLMKQSSVDSVISVP